MNAQEQQSGWSAKIILSAEKERPVPLGSVWIATGLNGKQIGDMLADLMKRFPLPIHMQHLKRVRFNRDTKVSEIIIKCKEDTETAEKIAALLNTSHDIVERMVPFSKPLTKPQYESCRDLWPSTFHEDKEDTRAIQGTFFQRSEIEKMHEIVMLLMKEARAASKEGGAPNASAVYDPSSGEIVTMARDCRQSGKLHHSIMRLLETLGRLPRKRKDDYLCTDLHVITLWEPCPMCAMALVHSRVHTVFFCFQSTSWPPFSTPGLKLHQCEDLNHKFKVFQLTHDQQSGDFEKELQGLRQESLTPNFA
eukprot:Clim_evm14s234 gene=Clim_evmTU14s234